MRLAGGAFALLLTLSQLVTPIWLQAAPASPQAGQSAGIPGLDNLGSLFTMPLQAGQSTMTNLLSQGANSMKAFAETSGAMMNSFMAPLTNFAKGAGGQVGSPSPGGAQGSPPSSMPMNNDLSKAGLSPGLMGQSAQGQPGGASKGALSSIFGPAGAGLELLNPLESIMTPGKNPISTIMSSLGGGDVGKIVGDAQKLTDPITKLFPGGEELSKLIKQATGGGSGADSSATTTPKPKSSETTSKKPDDDKKGGVEKFIEKIVQATTGGGKDKSTAAPKAAGSSKSSFGSRSGLSDTELPEVDPFKAAGLSRSSLSTTTGKPSSGAKTTAKSSAGTSTTTTRKPSTTSTSKPSTTSAKPCSPCMLFKATSTTTTTTTSTTTTSTTTTTTCKPTSKQPQQQAPSAPNPQPVAPQQQPPPQPQPTSAIVSTNKQPQSSSNSMSTSTSGSSVTELKELIKQLMMQNQKQSQSNALQSSTATTTTTEIIPPPKPAPMVIHHKKHHKTHQQQQQQQQQQQVVQVAMPAVVPVARASQAQETDDDEEEEEEIVQQFAQPAPIIRKRKKVVRNQQKAQQKSATSASSGLSTQVAPLVQPVGPAAVVPIPIQVVVQPNQTGPRSQAASSASTTSSSTTQTSAAAAPAPPTAAPAQTQTNVAASSASAQKGPVNSEPNVIVVQAPSAAPAKVAASSAASSASTKTQSAPTTIVLAPPAPPAVTTAKPKVHVDISKTTVQKKAAVAAAASAAVAPVNKGLAPVGLGPAAPASAAIASNQQAATTMTTQHISASGENAAETTAAARAAAASSRANVATQTGANGQLSVKATGAGAAAAAGGPGAASAIGAGVGSATVGAGMGAKPVASASASTLSTGSAGAANSLSGVPVNNLQPGVGAARSGLLPAARVNNQLANGLQNNQMQTGMPLDDSQDQYETIEEVIEDAPARRRRKRAIVKGDSLDQDASELERVQPIGKIGSSFLEFMAPNKLVADRTLKSEATAAVNAGVGHTTDAAVSLVSKATNLFDNKLSGQQETSTKSTTNVVSANSGSAASSSVTTSTSSNENAAGALSSAVASSQSTQSTQRTTHNAGLVPLGDSSATSNVQTTTSAASSASSALNVTGANLSNQLLAPQQGSGNILGGLQTASAQMDGLAPNSQSLSLGQRSGSTTTTTSVDSSASSSSVQTQQTNTVSLGSAQANQNVADQQPLVANNLQPPIMDSNSATQFANQGFVRNEPMQQQLQGINLESQLQVQQQRDFNTIQNNAVQNNAQTSLTTSSMSTTSAGSSSEAASVARSSASGNVAASSSSSSSSSNAVSETALLDRKLAGSENSALNGLPNVVAPSSSVDPNLHASLTSQMNGQIVEPIRQQVDVPLHVEVANQNQLASTNTLSDVNLMNSNSIASADAALASSAVQPAPLAFGLGSTSPQDVLNMPNAATQLASNALVHNPPALPGQDEAINRLTAMNTAASSESIASNSVAEATSSATTSAIQSSAASSSSLDEELDHPSELTHSFATSVGLAHNDEHDLLAPAGNLPVLASNQLVSPVQQAPADFFYPPSLPYMFEFAPLPWYWFRSSPGPWSLDMGLASGAGQHQAAPAQPFMSADPTPGQLPFGVDAFNSMSGPMPMFDPSLGQLHNPFGFGQAQPQAQPQQQQPQPQHELQPVMSNSLMLPRFPQQQLQPAADLAGSGVFDGQLQVAEPMLGELPYSVLPSPTFNGLSGIGTDGASFGLSMLTPLQTATAPQLQFGRTNLGLQTFADSSPISPLNSIGAEQFANSFTRPLPLSSGANLAAHESSALAYRPNVVRAGIGGQLVGSLSDQAGDQMLSSVEQNANSALKFEAGNQNVANALGRSLGNLIGSQLYGASQQQANAALLLGEAQQNFGSSLDSSQSMGNLIKAQSLQRNQQQANVGLQTSGANRKQLAHENTANDMNWSNTKSIASADAASRLGFERLNSLPFGAHSSLAQNAFKAGNSMVKLASDAARSKLASLGAVLGSSAATVPNSATTLIAHLPDQQVDGLAQVSGASTQSQVASSSGLNSNVGLDVGARLDESWANRVNGQIVEPVPQQASAISTNLNSLAGNYAPYDGQLRMGESISAAAQTTSSATATGASTASGAASPSQSLSSAYTATSLSGAEVPAQTTTKIETTTKAESALGEQQSSTTTTTTSKSTSATDDVRSATRAASANGAAASSASASTSTTSSTAGLLGSARTSTSSASSSSLESRVVNSKQEQATSSSSTSTTATSANLGTTQQAASSSFSTSRQTSADASTTSSSTSSSSAATAGTASSRALSFSGAQAPMQSNAGSLIGESPLLLTQQQQLQQQQQQWQGHVQQQQDRRLFGLQSQYQMEPLLSYNLASLAPNSVPMPMNQMTAASSSIVDGGRVSEMSIGASDSFGGAGGSILEGVQQMMGSNNEAGFANIQQRYAQDQQTYADLQRHERLGLKPKTVTNTVSANGQTIDYTQTAPLSSLQNVPESATFANIQSEFQMEPDLAISDLRPIMLREEPQLYASELTGIGQPSMNQIGLMPGSQVQPYLSGEAQMGSMLPAMVATSELAPISSPLLGLQQAASSPPQSTFEQVELVRAMNPQLAQEEKLDRQGALFAPVNTLPADLLAPADQLGAHTTIEFDGNAEIDGTRLGNMVTGEFLPDNMTPLEPFADQALLPFVAAGEVSVQTPLVEPLVEPFETIGSRLPANAVISRQLTPVEPGSAALSASAEPSTLLKSGFYVWETNNPLADMVQRTTVTGERPIVVDSMRYQTDALVDATGDPIDTDPTIIRRIDSPPQIERKIIFPSGFQVTPAAVGA